MTIAATDADEAAILLQATLAEVDDQEHDELMRLAREARQQGWRQHYGDLGITPLTGLQAVAVSLADMSLHCLVAASDGGSTRAIRRKPPQFWMLLDRSVLRRRWAVEMS